MKIIILVLSILFLTGCTTQNSDLTYNQVVNLKDKSIKQEIIWYGKVATDLSQIDGIKFWIIDKEHTNKEKWFWSYDEDTQQLPQEASGNWVNYTLNKYVGISDHNEDTIFEIKGEVINIDCDVAEYCVPNVRLSEINYMSETVGN